MNAIIRSSKIVPGGGAIELELHKEISNYSKEFSGREALIINSFSNAFLSIPKTICKNSGFDELDFISTLISKHESGEKNCGIDGMKGIVSDTFKSKIIEPIEVKRQAIKSAVESSSMILRIDDIIAARKLHQEERHEF